MKFGKNLTFLFMSFICLQKCIAMELPAAPQEVISQEQPQSCMIDVTDFVARMGVEQMATYAVKANNVPLLQFTVGARQLNLIKLENYEIGLLHMAARHDSVDAARWLIKHGIEINWPSHTHGETPVFIAAERSNVKILQFLLGESANCAFSRSNYSRRYHESPLELAIQKFLGERKAGGMPKDPDEEERETLVIALLIDKLSSDDLALEKRIFDEKINSRLYPIGENEASNTFYPSPPRNSYFMLLPDNARKAVQKMVEIAPPEKILKVFSFFSCEAARFSRIMLPNVAPESYFSLLELNLRLFVSQRLSSYQSPKIKPIVDSKPVLQEAPAIPAVVQPPQPAANPPIIQQLPPIQEEKPGAWNCILS